MRRLALVVIIVANPTASILAAPITYPLVNYNTQQKEQNGFDLTGTITTDGRIGFITMPVFPAWTYTVSYHGIALDSESGSGIDVFVGGTPTCTATDFLLPHGPVDLLEFYGAGSGVSPYLIYSNQPGSFGISYVAASTTTTFWNTSPTTLGGAQIGS